MSLYHSSLFYDVLKVRMLTYNSASMFCKKGIKVKRRGFIVAADIMVTVGRCELIAHGNNLPFVHFV